MDKFSLGEVNFFYSTSDPFAWQQFSSTDEFPKHAGVQQYTKGHTVLARKNKRTWMANSGHVIRTSGLRGETPYFSWEVREEWKWKFSCKFQRRNIWVRKQSLFSKENLWTLNADTATSIATILLTDQRRRTYLADTNSTKTRRKFQKGYRYVQCSPVKFEAWTKKRYNAFNQWKIGHWQLIILYTPFNYILLL